MRRPRVLGGGLAGMVALAIIGLAWSLDVVSGRGNGGLPMFLPYLVVPGLPVATVLGAVLAPWAAGDRESTDWTPVAIMGSLTHLFGGMALGIAILAGDQIPDTSPAGVVAGGVIIGFYGAITFGLPMLGITMPAALLWSFLLRRVVNGGPISGRVVVTTDLAPPLLRRVAAPWEA